VLSKSTEACFSSVDWTAAFVLSLAKQLTYEGVVYKQHFSLAGFNGQSFHVTWHIITEGA